MGLKNITKLFTLFSIGVLLISCVTSKLSETPISQFEGIWELQGRKMFNGMKIKIEKNEKDKLIGKVIELNDNKYVRMFVEENDIWIKSISRYSNFEFKLVENKIAKDLFSIYGFPSSDEYKVEFIDKTKIGLATGNSAPTESSVIYIRID
ncbi:hypothetical protein [Marinilabilia sp.]|uniref:hypothetical protein n=1 Tax=Marinilabilia sp. TaxID=2021252 RepID=UPI0025BD90C3|nr:hypothetical protein [Marinilabilia sp.]